MVNNIDEGGLSKSNKVLVKFFLGAMSEKMLEEMDEIINKKKKKNLLLFMQEPMIWPTISTY